MIRAVGVSDEGAVRAGNGGDDVPQAIPLVTIRTVGPSGICADSAGIKEGMMFAKRFR